MTLSEKFPGYNKDWFDRSGQIWIPGGTDQLRKYKSTVYQYRQFKEEAIDNDIEERNFLRQLLQPEPVLQRPPIVSKAIPEKFLGKTVNQKNMPGPTKRSKAWKSRNFSKRRKGKPLRNKALSSVKVPFKKVIDVDSNKAGVESGQYFNNLRIKELDPPMMAIYEEFKCVSMRVRFIPDDITAGSGLYAAILLDQTGFGTPVKAAETWFPRVADMPGSRVCHVTRGCSFNWKPTEPDSRNYQKVVGSETNYVVGTLYMFGKTSATRIKGTLLITGALRARGEYYTADVSARLKAMHLDDVATNSEAASSVSFIET